ncbi:hypothetical protein [Hymenobacter qilianensis]|uniref:hypothetical protein n=1 Tax=Hymenobacter qilianensis TaxID=1385715 RepID=UPI00293BBBFD|nr:hypothetical protein [Hymenobacter qilianensis]
MSIVNDIRTAFSRRDNALNQLLLINILVFVVLILIKAVTFLAGARASMRASCACSACLPTWVRWFAGRGRC